MKLTLLKKSLLTMCFSILINELDARVDPGAMEGPRFTP